MNFKRNMTTVVAGLVLAAALPAQAQLLGGAVNAAGNAVLGGGQAGIGGNLGGHIGGDLSGVREAARERVRSTADQGREVAGKAKSAGEAGVQKARDNTKRDVKADGSLAGNVSADRDGLDFGATPSANASAKRSEPAAQTQAVDAPAAGGAVKKEAPESSK
jgi:hypothetical protein